MASNKTALGLNQWEATDPIKRVDFNEDNLVIDAQLQEMRAQIGRTGDWMPMLNNDATTNSRGKYKKIDNLVFIGGIILGSPKGVSTQEIIVTGFPFRPTGYLDEHILIAMPELSTKETCFLRLRDDDNAKIWIEPTNYPLTYGNILRNDVWMRFQGFYFTDE